MGEQICQLTAYIKMKILTKILDYLMHLTALTLHILFTGKRQAVWQSFA